jgi:hypothetical protein
MNLTKEEVKNLASEQQEALASFEIQRIKKRERLLEIARSYRVPWFAALWPPLLFALVMVPMFLTDRLFLVLSIMFIAFGLQWVNSVRNQKHQPAD